MADSAAKAITEFQKTGEIFPVSRFIPELQPIADRAAQEGEARRMLLSISADLLNALYARADLTFRSEVMPRMNSPVPGEKYPAGTDPKSIKEQDIRQEYEKILAKDRSYAEHYGRQVAIFREIDRIGQLLWRADAKPAPAAIRDALVAAGMRSSYADHLLPRIEELKPKS